MSFKSRVQQRTDGRWMVVVTEDDKLYHFTKAEPWEPFTPEELLRHKLDAMKAFDGGRETT